LQPGRLRTQASERRFVSSGILPRAILAAWVISFGVDTEIHRVDFHVVDAIMGIAHYDV
jgi:hypothetical protein